MTESGKMILLSDQFHTLSTSSIVSEALVFAEQKDGWSQKLMQIFLSKRKIHWPCLISSHNSSFVQAIGQSLYQKSYPVSVLTLQLVNIKNTI